MQPTAPILEGRGNSDYERYVRVAELLELQKPLDQLVNPEELLFQTTHQTAEIWLKQIDYEIDRTVVFLETMAPVDYHVIRTSSLGRGSGQESPGFNKLLDVGKRLWPRFQAAMGKRSLGVLDLERNPRDH